jgi:hypothetical protein
MPPAVTHLGLRHMCDILWHVHHVFKCTWWREVYVIRSKESTLPISPVSVMRCVIVSPYPPMGGSDSSLGSSVHVNRRLLRITESGQSMRSLRL